MILIDFSRLSIAGVIALLGRQGGNIEVDLARHFILNTIRSVVLKHRREYGPDIIIACDSRKNWRKEVFPYYKGNRNKERDASGIDWAGIFEAQNIIKPELQEFFPYRVIEVEGAEADDVIGTLCHKFGNTGEKILICADDKDFYQLQVYMNVHQYDPLMKKRMLVCPNPQRYLKEHIIRGDTGDGVPNCLSDDDCLVVSTKRQNSIFAKHLEVWMNQDPSQYEEKMLRGYKRNEQVIDLTHIPNEIRESILKMYEDEAGKDKSKLMSYFMEKRLRNLLTNIGDF